MARLVRAIKARGGRVLVQDLATPTAAGMPRATLATGCSDFCFSPAMLARALIALVMVPGAAALIRVPALPRWRPTLAAEAVSSKAVSQLTG